MPTVILLLLGALALTCGSSQTTSQRTCAPVVQQTHSAHGCMQRAAVGRLRGGADEESEDDELDTELEAADEGLVEDATSDPIAADGLSNPFLGAGGAPGGAGGLGLGLQDLASTLQDPNVLQEALKELQDPATQARVKAMMEDPEFQESMKQYMEQMTKDPAFDQLKQQAEAMLSQEGFMEQMSQAFAEMGKGLADVPKSDKD